MVPMPAQSSSDDRSEMLENCIAVMGAGDRSGLTNLYNETYGAVFGLVLSILKNRHDAEDVLQDVYVQLWQSAPNYRPMGKPLAWIFTITRNLALSNIRRMNKTVSVAPEDWPEIFADTPMADGDDRLILSSLLETLDDDEQQIVMLHAVAGLKHREIAELLDMNLSTVLSKYSRALKKLRSELGEEEQI